MGSSIEPKASLPIFDGDKLTSGEPASDTLKVVSSKSVDCLQVPCTTSSMGDLVRVSKRDKVVSFLEPAGLSSDVFCNKNMDASLTFSTPSITTSAGVGLESKLAKISSSSTAFAGPSYCSPKVPELEKAYGKNNSFSGTFGRSGTHFSYGSTVNNSNPVDGPLPTSASFSSGQSTIASSSSLFSSTSASAATSAVPIFEGPGLAFQFGSAPPDNSEMNMEDIMEVDGVQGSTFAAPPVFPQQPVTPIPNFANPFQFGGQRNFSAATSAQPVFNNLGPAFQFSSAPCNNSEMDMEDIMEEDGVQGSTIAAPPVFPQQPVTPMPNFANPFQFGGQRNLSAATSAQPVFNSLGPAFQFGSAPNNSSTIAAPLLFPQQPVTAIPNVAFSSLTNLPGAAIPFHFGGQQNFSAYQNASPFHPPASLDLPYCICFPSSYRNSTF